MNFSRTLPGLLGACLLSGCASTVVVRDVTVSDPDAAWARVLKNYVDEGGRVDFVAVSKNRGDLEGYLAHVARTSPASHPDRFPSAESRMAYYLNAYNALSMYNVLHFEIPSSNGSFYKRFRFFYLTKYKIGGETMSLYAFENNVIRPVGDPRVHVALNCMARACPRLPQVPFDAKHLEAQLDGQAKEFYNEKRNVEVDHKLKRVRLSEILKFFTEDFLKKSPSLILYVNQYRREKIPDNYEVEFIDYDWTINSQPAKQLTSESTENSSSRQPPITEVST